MLHVSPKKKLCQWGTGENGWAIVFVVVVVVVVRVSHRNCNAITIVDDDNDVDYLFRYVLRTYIVHTRVHSTRGRWRTGYVSVSSVHRVS